MLVTLGGSRHSDGDVPVSPSCATSRARCRALLYLSLLINYAVAKALPLCASAVILPRQTPATNSFLLPSLSRWDVTMQFAATHSWWHTVVFRECLTNLSSAEDPLRKRVSSLKTKEPGWLYFVFNKHFEVSFPKSSSALLSTHFLHNKGDHNGDKQNNHNKDDQHQKYLNNFGYLKNNNIVLEN